MTTESIQWPVFEFIQDSDFVRSLHQLLHPPQSIKTSRPAPKAASKRPRITAQQRSASSENVKVTKKRSRPSKSGARHVTRHSDSHIQVPLSPIDALASAAAQAQYPTFESPQRPTQLLNRSPAAPQYYTSTWQAVPPGSYGSHSERPAKRARSEAFPSSHLGSPSYGAQPARPGTSYMNTFRWGYNVDASIDNGQRLGAGAPSLQHRLPPQSPEQREEQRLSDAELLLGFSRAASAAPKAQHEVTNQLHVHLVKPQINRGLPPFPYTSPDRPQATSTAPLNAQPSETAKRHSIPNVSIPKPSVEDNVFSDQTQTRNPQTQTPPDEEKRLDMEMVPTKVEEAPKEQVPAGLGLHYTTAAEASRDVKSTQEPHQFPDGLRAILGMDKVVSQRQLDTPQSLIATTDVKDTPSPHDYGQVSAPSTLASALPITSEPTAEEVLAALSKSNTAAAENNQPAGMAVQEQHNPAVEKVTKVRRRKEETKCAACKWEHENFPSGEFVDWLQCNGCKEWFHIQCAGFTKKEIQKIGKFHCVKCRPKLGKTTFVRKSSRAHTSVDYAGLNEGVLRTSDETPEHHYIKPIKDGTITFKQENFPRMRPEELTKEYFETCLSFSEPILIPCALNPPRYRADGIPVTPTDVENQPSVAQERDDLFEEPAFTQSGTYEQEMVTDDGQDKMGMVIPKGLTVRKVAELHGADMPLEVIDVKNQEGDHSKKWTVGKWADYYESTGEKMIRNVISLEVSRSPLGRLIRRPQVVRDLDLQDSVWPESDEKRGYVGFYCLMSVADSYTDFHIDFGGSSVYYHILKGRKTFFFIAPTKGNLKKYEDWCRNRAQASIFLPDSTKECYRVDLFPGDTMLIPSGWIHAVWTPEDSLVIGGNFLTRLHYPQQMRVAEIERNCKVGAKFKYPYFQKVLWYTLGKYLEDDPLPDTVRRCLYSGQMFEREKPLWLEVDQEDVDPELNPELFNARYYSKLELEGLPDLLSYIFRTIMIYLDRLEGVSQDTRRAVRNSIPKKAGEPVEAAKTFAAWVAWKRGTEYLPIWAHPNGKGLVKKVSEDEPTDKSMKCTAAEMKKLERQAAVTDFELPEYLKLDPLSAPIEETEAKEEIKVEVSSEQQRNAGDAGITGVDETMDDAMVTQAMDEDAQLDVDDNSSTEYTFVDGHAISTPKTSALGPRRTACDVCRKRKMRCKHMGEFGHLPFPPDFDELDPSLLDDLNTEPLPEPVATQEAVTETLPPTDTTPAPAQAPLPEAATTPVPALKQEPFLQQDDFMDGRKARTKACNECRRSKRRCIHDENGNIDPVKQAEPIVPRGTTVSKKRKSSGNADNDASKRLKEEDMTDSIYDPMLFATDIDKEQQATSSQTPVDAGLAPIAPMLMHRPTDELINHTRLQEVAQLASQPLERQASTGSQRGPNGVGIIVEPIVHDNMENGFYGNAVLSSGIHARSMQAPITEDLNVIDPELQAFIHMDPITPPPMVRTAQNIPVNSIDPALSGPDSLHHDAHANGMSNGHSLVETPNTHSLEMQLDPALMESVPVNGIIEHVKPALANSNGQAAHAIDGAQTRPTVNGVHSNGVVSRSAEPPSMTSTFGPKAASMSPTARRRRQSLSVKPSAFPFALNGSAISDQDLPEEERENLRLAMELARAGDFSLRRRS